MGRGASVDIGRMAVDDLVLVQGIRDTRETLAAWNRRPWQVLRPWLALSVAIAAVLLLTIYLISNVSRPDPTRFTVLGIHRPGTPIDVAIVLYRNSLVLALHAMACVAGFIARSSLPLTAAQYSGAWRWVHDRAGSVAIAFVVFATSFSFLTQAYVLGHNTSTIAAQLGLTNAQLLSAYLPHAIPELTAVFLPLAAWLIASRRGDWGQLLAATFVTVAIAAPVLVVCATMEVYVAPQLLQLYFN
jgi:hypothetical protein